MELIRNIRLKIGKIILSTKMSRTNRKVFYSNISLVKKIGIIWDTSRSEDFPYLSKFHLKMQEKNIEVKMIGYYPGKILPDQYTALRYMTFIRKKEINFFYIPVSPEIKAFINEPVEILIDINFKRVFPLQYISSLSSAGFKVGLFDSESNNTPFDMMMEIKKPVDVESYLNQVILYLEMINSGDGKKID